MVFDPYIWIPSQRLLEMSKWVSQGAEAASPTIASVRDIHTHRSPVFATLLEGIQDLYQVPILA